MAKFSQGQETIVNREIKAAKRRLQMVAFQQAQAKQIQAMLHRVGQGPYVEPVKQTMIEISTSKVVTPRDIPDQAVALLNELLLSHGQCPNPESEFAYPAASYQ